MLASEAVDIGRNPARRSHAFARLLPAGVAAAELHTPGMPWLLAIAERCCIKSAHGARQAEFAAGRHCAARALAELGVHNEPVLRTADRAPQWPLGLVGSITHTVGYSAAVVAKRGRLLSVGIDAEVISHLRPSLWGQLYTAAELAKLRALPQPVQQRAAAVCFTAKEAFYKCQYPLTRQWLDFDAVEIDSRDWAAATGTFTVTSRVPMSWQGGLAMSLAGAFLSVGEILCSAIAIDSNRADGDSA